MYTVTSMRPNSDGLSTRRCSRNVESDLQGWGLHTVMCSPGLMQPCNSLTSPSSRNRVALQVAVVERLSVRHFGRSKLNLCKVGAPPGLTPLPEHEALLAETVRDQVEDERKYLRSTRTVSNIDRVHLDFSRFLLPWRTHRTGHWATGTPESVPVYQALQ